MKATRRPLGRVCSSSGKGNALAASGAAGAEAAASAATSGKSMRFLRGARMVAEGGRKARKEMPRRTAVSGLQSRLFRVARPERKAVLARRLRLVHGAVGAIEQLLRSVGSGLEPGHPNRRAHVEPRVPLAQRAGAGEEPVRERLDGGALCIGEEDRELVATEAGRDVAGADGLADRLGHLPEELVALDVALVVVDALEVVDVDVGDGDRMPAAARSRQLVREPLEEGAPVRHAGVRDRAGPLALRLRLWA